MAAVIEELELDLPTIKKELSPIINKLIKLQKENKPSEVKVSKSSIFKVGSTQMTHVKDDEEVSSSGVKVV